MKKNSKNRSVSGRKLSRKSIAAIVTGAYLLFLVLGITVIFLFPFLWNRTRLLDLAESKGRYTLSHYTNSVWTPIPSEYYLFTENGALVTSNQNFTAPDWAVGLRDMIPELISSSNVYRLQWLRGESGSRMVTVAGKTVRSGAGRLFVSFIVRDFSDVTVTVLTFAGVFTFLFLVSIFIIIFIMKQHDDLLKMQRDLVSNVSHELKTPITSIKAMAEMLYDGMYRTEEDRKRFSKTVLDESDRLNELVHEILNLSRLQSNREKMEKTACYADSIFNPLLDRYMMMCDDLGISMDVSGLDLLAIPPLYTDEFQIIKVWMVILDNAMKFAGKGGLITVTQEPENDKVTFCVKDDGPGIDRKDINRIFDRFYKADVTRNTQGSGLGLAIAKEIMRGLKEKIWVESVEGEGSSFFFTVSYK